MLALHIKETPALRNDSPRPQAQAGEALIGLRLAGVCDTDIQLARGYMNFQGIPGHEFVGQVLECEDPAWIGRRVVGDINAGCGVCEDCKRGSGHHCQARSVLGILNREGCFAECFRLPVRNLVEVPDDMPDEVAVFAEPLAAALHVVDDLGDEPGQDLAVLGDGKLGILCALALHGAGERVTLIGHHESKLEIARLAGIQGALSSSPELEHARFDLVVEATGSPRGLAAALDLARPRGTIVLKSTLAGGIEVDLSPLVIHELRLVGSRCGDMSEAVSLLASGEVDPRPLIEARYPLERAVEALEHAGRGGVLKILVDGGLQLEP